MPVARPPRFWFEPSPVAAALVPLAWLFRGITRLRRAYWRSRSVACGAPVIVVGNLVVGGAGKTPLVIHLAQRATERGWSPGIVLRGYGGRATHWPQWVTADSDPRMVGDEAVLIARRTGEAVAAGSDRVAAARLLVAAGCDLVISDDGLQHYRLRRDREIVVVDGDHGLGNRRCLPAGPLREPPQRLASVDLIIARGHAWPQARGVYELATAGFAAVGGARTSPAPERGQRVHAVAGIGDPERFFATLRTLGLEPVPHAFADHHVFSPADLAFEEPLPVVMTEKDAVKCAAFAPPGCWYLPVSARPDARAGVALDELLDSLVGYGS
ncbi:tetraacyldisaccharide 4'-kinase [Arhodomonas sp. AD133]|uniref:tetraacyldisaccharide 4'-kinase n=1 Tax=Arhodomonas sp. AD133 TaxID=3415009 RepID=UPI003EB9B91B